MQSLKIPHPTKKNEKKYANGMKKSRYTDRGKNFSSINKIEKIIIASNKQIEKSSIFVIDSRNFELYQSR
jgi:hypothetical protein